MDELEEEEDSPEPCDDEDIRAEVELRIDDDEMPATVDEVKRDPPGTLDEELGIELVLTTPITEAKLETTTYRNGQREESYDAGVLTCTLKELTTEFDVLPAAFEQLNGAYGK